MAGFTLKTTDDITARFRYYTQEAPVTSKAFDALLPFKRTFIHAKVSGNEIWINGAPPIDIIQENASVFATHGEAVYGPLKPTRNKTSNCMGIYYGEGKGVDCCNIFAKVYDEDLPFLKIIGERIWKSGEQELTFERLA
jgi:hypothetical protein